MPKKTATPVLLTVTVPSKAEAKLIIRALLAKKLIACGQIIGPTTSVYRWKGKIIESKEYILIAKTMSVAVKDSVDLLEEMHSYDCPVIEVLEVVKMNTKALSWLRGSIK